jgi:hypothetical protein
VLLVAVNVICCYAKKVFTKVRDSPVAAITQKTANALAAAVLQTTARTTTMVMI